MMIREFLGRVPAGVRFGSLERRGASVGLSAPNDSLVKVNNFKQWLPDPFLEPMSAA